MKINYNKYKKGRGWHGQSYRHYLASKGISTRNRYFSDMYLASDELRSKFDGPASAKPTALFDNRDDSIYIFDVGTDPELVSDIIAHEELHGVLKNELDLDTSHKLDNIQTLNHFDFDAETRFLQNKSLDIVNTLQNHSENMPEHIQVSLEKHLVDIYAELERRHANVGVFEAIKEGDETYLDVRPFTDEELKQQKKLRQQLHMAWKEQAGLKTMSVIMEVRNEN